MLGVDKRYARDPKKSKIRKICARHLVYSPNGPYFTEEGKRKLKELGVYYIEAIRVLQNTRY